MKKGAAMEGKKVMIVEDDMLLSLVEERLVKSLGYQVIGKTISGESTLDKINTMQPDILIMDIQLAGKLNGIETVRQLRKDFKLLPVIFLSGHKDEKLKAQAEELGCIDFLVKPATTSSLSEPLKKAATAVDKNHSHAA